MPPKRLLILGGTGEGAELARAACLRYGDGLEVISSLAGRVERPGPLPGRVRIGGFGGVAGLAEFLRRAAVDAVIDATHPFAARISANADAACAAAGVPRLVLARPPWVRQEHDRWVEVDDMEEAAQVLPQIGRRALLTVGGNELAAFARACGVWFLVRLVEPPAGPLPLGRYDVTVGKGPFTVDDERRLLAERWIDVVVTKASGGEATIAKITAARETGLPVLMVRRPPAPPGKTVESVYEALAWIDRKLRPAA